MPSFWDAGERAALCRRVEQLTPDAAARWGKFNAARMMSHLNDSLRMASGDLPVAPKNLPLRYFPPDSSYAVPAELKLSDTRPVVELPTSTGELRRMQIVGTLEFTLNGQKLSLGALSPAGEPIRSLFVPFADLTTKKETYVAGRYLDIDPTATGIYTIDFNYAYNPTCAYNNAYSCPYPPPSNQLKIAVRAGEKAPGL